MSMMMMETPVAFPLVPETPHRVYMVNDLAGTVKERLRDTADTKGGGYHHYYYSDESFVSSSSISILGSMNDRILTTSPVPDQPWVVVVMVLTTSASRRETVSSMIHLDFSECDHFKDIIKAQAFEVMAGECSNIIQLVVVDSAGVVLTLRFTQDLTPVAVPVASNSAAGGTATGQAVDVRCLRVADMVQVETSAAATVVLRSSMVAFLSADAVLLALNPLLLVVDLYQEKLVSCWSKTQTLETMKARSSNIRQLFAKSAELLLGKLDDTVIVDMKPVSAVCVADNDASSVFTLHSDGTVRLWRLRNDTVHSSRMLSPWSMHEIPVRHMPDSATWSDNTNSTYLTARIYRSVFVLAIHIQTTVAAQEDDIIEGLDASERPEASCNNVMIVVDGSISMDDGYYDDDTEVAETTHSIRLAVPVAADTLVGMQFDENYERCQMRALFRTAESNNSSSGGGTIFVTYPPSNLSIVNREPTVLPLEYSLDGVARQERDRIAALSFSKYCCNDGNSYEAILHEIDLRFLQYLFRPAFPRGTGSVLPPATEHIRRAMRKLGSFRDDNSASIEVEVVNFVQYWRRRDHQKIISMTPVKERTVQATAATPGSNMAYADSAAAESLSIYDAIAKDQEDEEMVVVVDMNDEEDSELCNKQREIEEHERRWRQLLLQIWEEEEIQRASVAFAIPSNTSDAAIIVRPGCVSAVTKCDWNNKNETVLSRLDGVALKFLDFVASNSDELQQAEQFAWESLSQGRLALLPEDVVKLKEMLLCLPSFDDIPDKEVGDMIRELVAFSDDQWMQLLHDTPLHSSLPGLCLVSNDEASPMQSRSPRNPVLGIQDRLAAASLVVRSTDSARHLFLGRFLVLSELATDAADAALLMYLHASNVLGVGARTVPLPVIATLDASLQQLHLDQSGLSPPRKRSRVTSLLETHGTRDKTVALDSLLIQLSQYLVSTAATGSLSEIATMLGRAAIINLCFHLNRSSSHGKLPELGMLVMSSDAITQPQLALRLLAPHVSLLGNNDESAVRREELLAECLLLASQSESSDQATKMIERAFILLRFDETNIDKSMCRLATLQNRIGGDRSVAGNALIRFIEDAIQRMEALTFVDNKNHEILWSALFNTAVSVRDWEKAHDACVRHPNVERKADNFKRLVRAMVDAGALGDLLTKCSLLASEPVSEGYADVYQNVVDFYGIAAETLAELGIRDIYTAKAVGQDPPADYLGALYALHVSQGQWKKAAQALDRRYVKAKDSLANPVVELSLEQQVRRERLIVDDLVLAAVSCHQAMSMVLDSNTKYLVSGGSDFTLAIPSYLSSENGGVKRGLGDELRSTGSQNRDSSGVYMNMDDIQARAVKCSALKTLFYDGFVDSTFAKSALVDESTSKITDYEIIDQLFLRGSFYDGIRLAMSLESIRGSKPNGRSVFQDSLSHLLCSYLLPVALDKKFTPERPTLRQLMACIDSLKQPFEPPVLIAGSRSKKISSLQRSEIQTAAMSLIRELTMKYTNAEQPIAVEVAACFLDRKRVARPLPPWLEDFILWGTQKMDLPGLFARRRKPGTNYYLGDPSALLSLYTKRGLYCDACRVVSIVFAGPDNTYREKMAPSRLPEKGEIDYVPYEKIDLLWNLIDVSLKKSVLGAEATHNLKLARSEMEKSMEKHFELLNISKTGMKSARALSEKEK